MIFSSGHHCNETTIGHLFGPKDLVIHDALAHNCIVQGVLLSGAQRRSFRHADLAHLDALLTQERHKFEKCGVIIEGVYSMDGDIAPIPEFLALRKKHKFFLYVDESHATGTVGAGGGGTRELFDVGRGEVDIWMGTLSKAFASCGGFICGNRKLIHYLKYTVPGFIFSAGISPANTAAALASVRQMKKEPQTVRRLKQNGDTFRELLHARDLDTGLSDGTAIVPLIVGGTEKAMALAQVMASRGVNVNPIGYPAVSEGEARLRFFIGSTHTEQDLTYTANALAESIPMVEEMLLSRQRKALAAPSMTDGEISDPTQLWRGWLYKLGEFNTAFKRRFFILSRTGELSWFQHEEDAVAQAAPKGSLSVRGAQLQSLAGATTGRFRFSITPASGSRTRRYILEAYTESIRDKCLAALSRKL